MISITLFTLSFLTDRCINYIRTIISVTTVAYAVFNRMHRDIKDISYIKSDEEYKDIDLNTYLSDAHLINKLTIITMTMLNRLTATTTVLHTVLNELNALFTRDEEGLHDNLQTLAP